MPTPLRTLSAAGIVAMACVSVVWWWSNSGAAANNVNVAIGPSDARLWVLRLQPGDDLVDSVMEFSRRNSIEAGGIVSCVGSLDRARLRYANQSEYENLATRGRHFEIVSFVGTFSTKDYHFHLAIANEKGDVFGGHASSGNKVYTTAEIMIVEGLDWEFRREVDPKTTYRELLPTQRKKAGAVDER
jgi:predicted DNA-binding protein with PD1-like motif